MSKRRKKEQPVLVSIESIATQANEVVSDVDRLVEQLKKMVKEQQELNRGHER